MRRFGYFVTESSGHASEYLPYFRKRPDLLASLVATLNRQGLTLGLVRLRPYRGRRRRPATQGAGLRAGDCPPDRRTEPIELRRSDEYGALIIHAAETGTALRINGNVPNENLITNLPAGACVEVPCLVDRPACTPVESESSRHSSPL